jgi:hypothetical protein
MFMPVVFAGTGSGEMKKMKIMKGMKEMSCAKRGNATPSGVAQSVESITPSGVAQSVESITPEAYPVNNAGIYPGEKRMKKINAPLGVASTLRRTENKAPALRFLFCKAGALLLTRRSVHATPSGGVVATVGSPKGFIFITAGQRPAGKKTGRENCLKGRTVSRILSPAFQAAGTDAASLYRGSMTHGYENKALRASARRSVHANVIKLRAFSPWPDGDGEDATPSEEQNYIN